MNDFRNKCSQILDIRILNDSDWNRIFTQLDREGKPDRKTVTQLLEVICTTVDSLVDDIAILKGENATNSRNR